MAELLNATDILSAYASGASARRIADSLKDCSPSEPALSSNSIKLTTSTTGTGSEQEITNALGVVPSLVLVVPTGAFNGITGEVTYGTHTATKIKVTVPNGLKYKVLYF